MDNHNANKHKTKPQNYFLSFEKQDPLIGQSDKFWSHLQYIAHGGY
jgi:hypothetical protein